MKQIIRATYTTLSEETYTLRLADQWKNFEFEPEMNNYPAIYPANLEVFLDYNSYGRLFLHEEEMKYLAPFYLAGTRIIFRQIGKAIRIKHAKSRMCYEYRDFDKNDIPKQLRNKTITTPYGTTALFGDLVSKVRGNFIPEHLTKVIDEYGTWLKDKINKYNRKHTDWEALESFYKRLYRLMSDNGVRTKSPNPKTAYEVAAENEFMDLYPTIAKTRRNYAELMLDIPEELSEQQLIELRIEGPAYGVEIRQVGFQILYHSTTSGYTQEPNLIFSTISEEDKTLGTFYKFAEDNAPYYVRSLAKPKTVQDNPALLLEAYLQLQYLKQFGDEFVLPDYKRCPICNKFYKETSGCLDTEHLALTGIEHWHVEPIELLNAPRKFYGDGVSFDETMLYSK